MRFFLLKYLAQQDNLTYIGFESNAVCNSPSMPSRIFDPAILKESWKCEKSSTGYFTPLCRGWYKNTKQNPNQSSMSDLYLFARADIFGITFCAPIKDQNRQFYAALCYDI